MEYNLDPSERNEYLRGLSEGEEVTVEASDRRTRTLEIVARIVKQNGGVVLKAEGHGTRYQIDVPRPGIEEGSVRMRWPSGSTLLLDVSSGVGGGELWSDTSAADLGIEGL